MLSQKRHTRAGVRYHTSRPWAGELFLEAVLKSAAGIKTERWEKRSKTPAPMVAPWGNRDQPVQRQRGFQERSVSVGLSIPTRLLSVGCIQVLPSQGCRVALSVGTLVWIFTAQLRWSMQMGRWRKRNGLACRTSARDTGFERHVVSCVLPRLTIPDFWVYTKAAILKSKQIVIWQIYDCNHCIVQVIYRFTYLHFQGERNGKISLKKKSIIFWLVFSCSDFMQNEI